MKFTAKPLSDLALPAPAFRGQSWNPGTPTQPTRCRVFGRQPTPRREIRDGDHSGFPFPSLPVFRLSARELDGSSRRPLPSDLFRLGYDPVSEKAAIPRVPASRRDADRVTVMDVVIGAWPEANVR